MKSPWGTVFGILCWLPAAAAIVFATSPWEKVLTQVSSKGVDQLKHVPASWWIWIAVPLGVAVLVQMGLAAWLLVHCDKRSDMTSGAKIAWPIGVMLVGSIFAPIFYFKKVRGHVEPGDETPHWIARGGCGQAAPGEPPVLD